jgi:hypothetical protein
MRQVFQHNVLGNIFNEFGGIMERNMYIKYYDKNNRVHKSSIRFITFMKYYIRGSMVRQSALFFRNEKEDPNV